MQRQQQRWPACLSSHHNNSFYGRQKTTSSKEILNNSSLLTCVKNTAEFLQERRNEIDAIFFGCFRREENANKQNVAK